MAKKVYLGNGKKKSPTWMKAIITDEVTKYWIQGKTKKFVKVDINIFDEPDQYGNDVSITLDTWVPEKKNEPAAELKKDNLPF